MAPRPSSRTSCSTSRRAGWRGFIDGDAALERRLAEADDAPDRDGRFRVNDFFCRDDAWRETLSHLACRTDAVIMDRRGFSRAATVPATQSAPV